MRTIVIAPLVLGCIAGLSLMAQTAKPVGPSPKPSTPKAQTPAKTTGEPAAVLQTTAGKIVIKFFPDKAPNHVKNFLALCKSGFYNGTKFHRVIPGFMIQGGDPNTKTGDPATWGLGGNVGKDGQEINVKAEFNDVHHARGIVSMARSSDPNSASSQFFICVADAGNLDHQYSAFGQVVEGMDVVDKIVSGPRDTSNDRPKNPVAIQKAWVEYLPGAEPAAKGAPAK